MITSEIARPPVPPFDRNAAIKKVRLAEDAWNTRDPEKVASGYTPDSLWRNRSEFFSGREAIIQFLRRKWARELDYRLVGRDSNGETVKAEMKQVGKTISARRF
jgi:nuclear transport factor 2 (NTF2) superfamily protein